jgi:hypothetical protein
MIADKENNGGTTLCSPKKPVAHMSAVLSDVTNSPTKLKFKLCKVEENQKESPIKALIPPSTSNSGNSYFELKTE